MEYRTDTTFIEYMTTLTMQAMIALGAMAHPVSGQMQTNIRQAKILIDTLVILQEKTSGNLTPQEKRVLDTAVADLQRQYVGNISSENM